MDANPTPEEAIEHFEQVTAALGKPETYRKYLASLRSLVKDYGQRCGWQKCDTHGAINADNAWGCPDCVAELRRELEESKSQLQSASKAYNDLSAEWKSREEYRTQIYNLQAELEESKQQRERTSRLDDERLLILNSDMKRELAAAEQRNAELTLHVRDADALADACAATISAGKLDPRSWIGDALLDYRNPPRTEHSDQLAEALRCNAELTKAVEDAPHAVNCGIHDKYNVEFVNYGHCNCWKSKALQNGAEGK